MSRSIRDSDINESDIKLQKFQNRISSMNGDTSLSEVVTKVATTSKNYFPLITGDSSRHNFKGCVKFFKKLKADCIITTMSVIRSKEEHPIVLHPIYKWPSLHCAALWGSFKSLEYLIKIIAIDVNYSEIKRGYTALHMAAIGNKRKCMEFLISKNALIDFEDNLNRTPIHLAAAHNASHCLDLLIQRGANIHATDSMHWTAVHHAAFHNRVGVLEVLVRNGAATDVTDFEGNTPAHLAAREGNLEAIKFLLYNGEREASEVYDSVNDHGHNLLDLASNYYKSELANFLTEANQSIGLQETRPNINFPAHVVAFRGNGERLETLVRTGVVGINQRDNFGYTLIHKGALGGRLSIVQWLLTNGANAEILTKAGESAIDIAKRRNHKDVYEYFDKLLNLTREDSLAISSSDGSSTIVLQGKQLLSAQTRAKDRFENLEKELDIARANMHQLGLKLPNEKNEEEMLLSEYPNQVRELNEMLELERKKRELLECQISEQNDIVNGLKCKLTKIQKSTDHQNKNTVVLMPRVTMVKHISD